MTVLFVTTTVQVQPAAGNSAQQLAGAAVSNGRADGAGAKKLSSASQLWQTSKCAMKWMGKTAAYSGWQQQQQQ